MPSNPYQSPEEQGALHAISKELNSLPKRADAKLSYDMLSDAFIWTDELPSNSAVSGEQLYCMQLVFRYRTTIILNAPDRELESLWINAQGLFPNWPGFDPARCVPDELLAADFHKYHQQALDALDAIPD